MFCRNLKTENTLYIVIGETVEISSSMRQKLEDTSEEMKMDEEEIVSKALTVYLDILKYESNLDEEFSAWDKASDEALI